MSRITMRDVARAAGVSPMTVSRALRGDEIVNDNTRTLVRETARRLGYVYDSTATAFRSQRSGFAAVTLPSINNANFADTFRGLSGVLNDVGLQVLLGSTGYRVEEEERLIRQLLQRRPEMLVLTGGHHSSAVRDLLAPLNVPVFEIWDLPQEAIGHAVGFSNADAMRPLVEHLANSGRRNLVFVGANHETDFRGAERRCGVIDAARALGLPEVRSIEIGRAPVSMQHGADAFAIVASDLGNVDALVCVSDPVAFGALSACQRAGVRVPDDLAITGFGAFEIARISCPTITTVYIDAEAIGKQTGELAVRLFNAQETRSHVRLDLGSRLQVGQTT